MEDNIDYTINQCCHLDYGKTAPMEYGMFCVRDPEMIILITNYDCARCEHYKLKESKSCKSPR